MSDYPVIGKMPAPKRRMSYDWAGLAEMLRQNPGKPVLYGPFKDIITCESVSVNVNYKTPALPLRELGGRVQAFVRDSVETESGRRRGDVWFEWTPDKQEEEA